MIKKLSFILFLCSIFMQVPAFAQHADDVLGRWMNSTNEGTIQVYKKGNQFFGKLIWIKNPDDPATGKPQLDKLNPDKKLQTQPVLGLEILKGFTFDGDDTYEGGTVYDPKSGKTYSCKMTINGNKLKMRGYIGVSLLGRTEIWTRVK